MDIPRTRTAKDVEVKELQEMIYDLQQDLAKRTEECAELRVKFENEKTINTRSKKQLEENGKTITNLMESNHTLHTRVETLQANLETSQADLAESDRLVDLYKKQHVEAVDKLAEIKKVVS